MGKLSEEEERLLKNTALGNAQHVLVHDFNIAEYTYPEWKTGTVQVVELEKKLDSVLANIGDAKVYVHLYFSQ